jgi:hypothetical protein
MSIQKISSPTHTGRGGEKEIERRERDREGVRERDR